MQTHKVLINDLVGMTLDQNGQPDHTEVKAYIEAKGGIFHYGAQTQGQPLEVGKCHFFYQPDLSTEQQILSQTADGQYDALITAATFIPAKAKFPFGGVRIGAGTGNMGSESWGGARGKGGSAPLMNTPGFNSRATAQMVMKALLSVLPDIDVEHMHRRVVANDFDTATDLAQYPTTKLEGKRIAILGYGNIGREVAKLAKAFAMEVVIYAREKHQQWIESEGFVYARSIVEAASGADVISPHLGLGLNNCNVAAIHHEVFAAMNPRSVLINYDRGELVDVDSLDEALSSGQIRFAAIDADIFKDSETGQVFGPMRPYLKLVDKHLDKLSLLPHAAADTDHDSRVAGAKQAVEQIFDVLLNRKVVNLVGELPDGYSHGGRCSVRGVGKVTDENINEVTQSERQSLAVLSKTVMDFWQGNSSDTAQAIESANQLAALMNAKGLLGPYE